MQTVIFNRYHDVHPNTLRISPLKLPCSGTAPGAAINLKFSLNMSRFVLGKVIKFQDTISNRFGVIQEKPDGWIKTTPLPLIGLNRLLWTWPRPYFSQIEKQICISRSERSFPSHTGADLGFSLGEGRRLRGGIFSRLRGLHVPEVRQVPTHQWRGRMRLTNACDVMVIPYNACDGMVQQQIKV